jgi:hypothetical protein
VLHKWIVSNDTYRVQMKAHTPYVIIACSKAFVIELDTLKDECSQNSPKLGTTGIPFLRKIFSILVAIIVLRS